MKKGVKQFFMSLNPFAKTRTKRDKRSKRRSHRNRKSRSKKMRGG